MAEYDDQEERTELATPRKRQEAREQGQVPLSQEIVAAVLLLALCLALLVGGGELAARFGAMCARGFEIAGKNGARELSVGEASGLVSGIAGFGLQTLLLLLAPIYAVGLLTGYGQIGFALTTKALSIDPAKLSPTRGWQRIFSMRGVMRTALAIAKILMISAAMGAAAWSQRENMVRLAALELGPALAGIGHVVVRCIAAGLAVVFSLALFDLVFQRWQHEKDLRMTKQEVREELKHTEGDPHVKARIRRVQREIARSRMMAEVPKATVVVTNPTHYAVALRYGRDDDASKGRAPRVVAKGVDHAAQRIKEVAREAGVVCYEDVPLARALHAKVEIGDEVPVELYQAVAGVLAYVYRLQKRPAPAA